MHPAALAGGEPVLLTLKHAQFRPSRFARSLSIGATKRPGGETAGYGKRAAVVLRRGMRQAEFHSVEARLNRNHLSSLAVLVGTNGKGASVPDAPLCGLIVTGSDSATHAVERAVLIEVVRDALGRELPVLAISDAVPLALSAAGMEPPSSPHQAVLIGDEVRALQAHVDIERAIDSMATAPPR